LDCNHRGAIDLHVHSTASDGTLTPVQILRRALALGLTAVAITDHDTVDGVRSALSHKCPKGIEFITGIEISAAPPVGFQIIGSLHILGYGILPEHPELLKTLAVLQKSRINRIPKIIRRLNQLGIPIREKDVQDQSGGGIAGRAHVAMAMVKNGYAQSMNDAFCRYIGKGQPAYVDKFRISSNDAIRIIGQAGGISVLAHPYLTTGNWTEIQRLVRVLANMGLQGLEVLYPEHPRQVREALAELTRQHRLLMTGGSDFHGSIKPEIEMGSGYGDLFVPFSIYQSLVRCAYRRHSQAVRVESSITK
jgi:predicted metal-dependent phosphoesterase TrpH